LRTLCLPSRNAQDIDDIPEDVRNEMTFILVDRVEQVFEAAFGNSEGTKSAQKQKKQRRAKQPGEDGMARD
jgi:ATP-dependent Lon protease